MGNGVKILIAKLSVCSFRIWWIRLFRNMFSFKLKRNNYKQTNNNQNETSLSIFVSVET
jgi:hypothetical protein